MLCKSPNHSWGGALSWCTASQSICLVWFKKLVPARVPINAHVMTLERLNTFGLMNKTTMLGNEMQSHRAVKYFRNLSVLVKLGNISHVCLVCHYHRLIRTGDISLSVNMFNSTEWVLCLCKDLCIVKIIITVVDLLRRVENWAWSAFKVKVSLSAPLNSCKGLIFGKAAFFFASWKLLYMIVFPSMQKCMDSSLTGAVRGRIRGISLVTLSFFCHCVFLIWAVLGSGYDWI